MRDLLPRRFHPVGWLVPPAMATALTAAYCLAYNALNGSDERLDQALVWGLINVAPWVVAVDLARRLRNPFAIVGCVLALGTLSLAADVVISGSEPGFAAIRRLPGFGLALAAIAIWHLLSKRHGSHGEAAGQFDPGQAEGCLSVHAAGNYVELHSDRGIRVARATLTQVERALGGRFVRVHRSILVRRDAVARIDRSSLLLRDGRRLALGKRFRSALIPD